MTPNGPLYFDAYQGDPNDEPLAIGSLTTPQDVYEYEPAPAALTPAQSRHIIGVQGNLWTEYVDSPDYLFYMLLPRMLSLSEIAWSDPHPRMWSAFSSRMGAQFSWLARHGYNFRIPNPEFGIDGASLRFANVSPSVRTVKAEIGTAQTNVAIATIVPGGVIHYTTDGTAPTAVSPVYGSPIALTLAPNQRAVIQAIVTMPSQRSSTVSELVLTRSGAYEPPAMIDFQRNIVPAEKHV
jgi:hexosaminidase